MSITANSGGVLHDLSSVTVNSGGTLKEFSTVYANIGGVLKEIFSALPKSLTWVVDTSKDSSAKISSTSNNGFTVTYTAKSALSSTDTSWGNHMAIKSNSFFLAAGTVISAIFSSLSSSGSSKYGGLCIIKPDGNISAINVESAGKTAAYTTESSGNYTLALCGHGVTGSSKGVTYYPATATATLSFSKT